MAIVLRGTQEKSPSVGQRLSQGIGQGLQMAQQMYDKHLQEQQMKQESEMINKLTGMDVSEIRDPKLRQEIVSQALQGKQKSKNTAQELMSGQNQVYNIAKMRGKTDQEAVADARAFGQDPSLYERTTKPIKPKEPSLTEKPVPHEISKKMKKIVADNPNATADNLRLLMDEAQIPPIYSNPYTENRRRTEEQASKTKEQRRTALRQETLPIRTDIANKAKIAEQSVRNKEQLIDLIEKGDINDPTYAALAESLPLNLGKRLLSPDTIEYKSGLVEEYGDLKNIFSGATRVKEIELLEAKIADIYLTNEQKKRVLKSRINAEKAHIIRAEAAAELEDREDLGILQFEKELEKIAKPKLDALFSQILDEQKAIIQEAESKKQAPLDGNDPDDIKIIDEILKEVGGDWKQAEKLARKKGYKF